MSVSTLRRRCITEIYARSLQDKMNSLTLTEEDLNDLLSPAPPTNRPDQRKLRRGVLCMLGLKNKIHRIESRQRRNNRLERVTGCVHNFILETYSRMIRDYQVSLHNIVDVLRTFNALWDNHVKQNDVLLISADQDLQTADDLKVALEARRPGIRIITSKLPYGFDILNSWYEKIQTVQEIVILVSKNLENDIVLLNFLPDILLRDYPILPVYLCAEYRNKLPPRFRPILQNMPVTDEYSNNPAYWAQMLDESNIRRFRYILRYQEECKKAKQLLSQIEQDGDFFNKHRHCCLLNNWSE